MIFGTSASSTALSCAAVISPLAAFSRASLSGAERRIEPTWSARKGGFVRTVMDVSLRDFLDRWFLLSSAICKPIPLLGRGGKWPNDAVEVARVERQRNPGGSGTA